MYYRYLDNPYSYRNNRVIAIIAQAQKTLFKNLKMCSIIIIMLFYLQLYVIYQKCDVNVIAQEMQLHSILFLHENIRSGCNYV